MNENKYFEIYYHFLVMSLTIADQQIAMLVMLAHL